MDLSFYLLKSYLQRVSIQDQRTTSGAEKQEHHRFKTACAATRGMLSLSICCKALLVTLVLGAAWPLRHHSASLCLSCFIWKLHSQCKRMLLFKKKKKKSRKCSGENKHFNPLKPNMCQDSPSAIYRNMQKKLLLFSMENNVYGCCFSSRVRAVQPHISCICWQQWPYQGLNTEILFQYAVVFKNFSSTDWKIIPTPVHKSLQVKCI